MPKKRVPIQQCLKRVDKICFFCGENDYFLLDSHRILEGSKGGTYCEQNCVTTCCLCHRKIHSGRIVIYGKHRNVGGKKLWVIHYNEDGVEKWR